MRKELTIAPNSGLGVGVVWQNLLQKFANSDGVFILFIVDEDRRNEEFCLVLGNILPLYNNCVAKRLDDVSPHFRRISWP